MPDPVQLQFEFPDDTGPLSNSWAGLAAISKDMRDSWSAINEGMSGTIELANKLRSALDLKNDVLSGIQSILDNITTSINLNDSKLNDSLSTIKQILDNSNNVTTLLNRAEGFAAPSAPSQGFSNPLANPMAYQTWANQTRSIRSDPFYSSGSQDSQFARVNETGYNGQEATNGPAAAAPRTAAARTSIGGLTRRAKNVVPADAFTEEAEAAMENTVLDNGRRIPLLTPPGNTPNVSATGGNALGKVYSTSNADALKGVLGAVDIASQYPNLAQYWVNDATGRSLINASNYGQAPMMAFNGMMNQLNESPLGMIPGMSNMLGSLSPVMQGINLLGANPSGTGINSYFNGIQQAVMSGMNSIVGKINNGASTTAGQYAINAAGVATLGAGAYGTLSAGADILRSKLFQPSQQLADLTGQSGSSTDLLKAYAEAMAGAYTKNEFGLNPLYSSVQAQTNVLAAAQLGLGANTSLSNQYTGLAKSEQINYGIGANEFQGMASNALAYGVSLNDYMSGYNATRQAAAKIGNTSTAYMGQSFGLGLGGSASAGFANSATGFGNAAVQFGAGNQIAQAAGMTGQELMGTPIGNALMAQEMGTTYMNTFAAAQKDTQAPQQWNKAMRQLLSDVGVDVNSVKSTKDLYKYAILLNMVLPQLGVTTVTSPLQAVTWAAGVLGVNSGSTTSAITSAATKTTGTTSVSSNTATQGVPSTSTLLTSSTDTSVLDNLMSGSGFSTASNAATTANGVTVQVNLAPGLQNILTATVQSATSTATSPSTNVTLNSAG
jgi:hypothetical protein